MMYEQFLLCCMLNAFQVVASCWTTLFGPCEQGGAEPCCKKWMDWIAFFTVICDQCSLLMKGTMSQGRQKEHLKRIEHFSFVGNWWISYSWSKAFMLDCWSTDKPYDFTSAGRKLLMLRSFSCLITQLALVLQYCLSFGLLWEALLGQPYFRFLAIQFPLWC